MAKTHSLLTLPGFIHLFDTIADHLEWNHIFQLKLTCKQLYQLCENYYRTLRRKFGDHKLFTSGNLNIINSSKRTKTLRSAFSSIDFLRRKFYYKIRDSKLSRKEKEKEIEDMANNIERFQLFVYKTIDEVNLLTIRNMK